MEGIPKIARPGADSGKKKKSPAAPAGDRLQLAPFHRTETNPAGCNPASHGRTAEEQKHGNPSPPHPPSPPHTYRHNTSTPPSAHQYIHTRPPDYRQVWCLPELSLITIMFICKAVSVLAPSLVSSEIVRLDLL